MRCKTWKEAEDYVKKEDMESQIKHYEMYKKILIDSFDPELCKKEFSKDQKFELQACSYEEVIYFEKMALLDSKIEEIKRSLEVFSKNGRGN